MNEVWYQPHHWLSWLLWPVSLLFCWLVSLRRWLYARQILRSSGFPVPVLVVGNITVGGTGKTPMVIWLAQQLALQGLKVGIVSRGYGGRTGYRPQAVHADSDVAVVGDEALVLVRRTGCPMVVASDRVAAIRQLLAEQELDAVISDDGLQHYAMRRDLEILLQDGRRAYGNRMCLPAGPLREPLSRAETTDIQLTVSQQRGNMFLQAGPVISVDAAGTQKRLSDFSNTPVHAVAGIADPERFFLLLEAQGLRIQRHAFDDHHVFKAHELLFDDHWPVLMTEKDAVKCSAFNNPRLWYLAVYAQLDEKAQQRLQMKCKELFNA
ncbi:MAG: tetraacyldisaccharide 4'-kinase [gamma proteobacterium symbiont of Bathyaustriella thionipta]|nr:tetraacyldisaccharide 4'-kinase [gamma proteobacterium symbiont of Bathyaustriella thionipta]